MSGTRLLRLALLAQLVVVLAAAWMIWGNVLAPHWVEGSLGPVLAEAALFVLTAWAVSAFALLWIYVLAASTEASSPGLLRAALRSSAPAMWLAPAMILMAALAPGPMFAGLILLINVTTILVRRWTRLRGIALPAPLFGSSLPSFAGGLAIQTGALALWLDYRLIAAALFFAASAILTAQSIVAGAYRPKKDPLLPPALLSPAVAFLLALTLTATGIEATTQGRGGPVESARAILRRLWHTPQSPAEPQQIATRLYLPRDPDAAHQESKTFGNGGFPGVVLRPRRDLQKQLSAPPRPTEGGRTEALSDPVHIPFTGEYWLYQSFLAPLISPPDRSAIRFGNPLELSFHTSDFRPMRMEAHQRLNPPVTLDCCSRIQLVVARRGEPEPVAIDLSAIDSTKFIFVPGRETWLGTAAMDAEATQTLSYTVPPRSRERKCDELEAVIRLEQYDGMQSAAESLHVEIEEIVLTP